MSRPTSLTDLPQELLDIICEHLDDNLDTLLALATLTKSLNRIALGKYYSIIRFDQRGTFLSIGASDVQFFQLASFRLDLHGPQFKSMFALFSTECAGEMSQLARLIQFCKHQYSATLWFPESYSSSPENGKMLQRLLCTIAQSPCHSISLYGRTPVTDPATPVTVVKTFTELNLNSSSFLMQPSLLAWIVQSANSSSVWNLRISCELPIRFLSQLELPRLRFLMFTTNNLPYGGFDEFYSFLLRHPSIEHLFISLHPADVPKPPPPGRTAVLDRRVRFISTSPAVLRYLLSSRTTFPAVKDVTIELTFDEQSTQSERAVLMTETLAMVSDHVSISLLEFHIMGDTSKGDWFDAAGATSLVHIVNIVIRFPFKASDVHEYLPLIPKWLTGFPGVKNFGCFGTGMDKKDPLKEKEFTRQVVEHCPNITVQFDWVGWVLTSWRRG